MKDFLIQVEKITGISDPDRACGVFTKRVSVENGGMGTVVAAVLVRSESEADLQVNTRDIFELLTKRLEGGSEGMLGVLEAAKENSIEYAKSKNIDLSFVYTFFFEDVCYIAKYGEDVKLLVFEPPKSLEITFESGSGPIKQGQIYLVATKKFLSVFDTGDLKQDAEIDFEDITDGIATEIAGEKEQSEIGAAFVHVKGDAIEEEKHIEEDKGVEESEVVLERDEEVAIIENAVETEPKEEQLIAVRRNPMAAVFGAVFAEFGKLRHGDNGAVLRFRRNVVVLAVLVFLILAGSVLFTLKQKSDQEKAATVAGYLSSASSKLDEGAALIELNKSRAREVLIDADRDVKQALNVDPKNEKAQSLTLQITSKLKETEISSNVSFETVKEVSTQLAGLAISGKNLVGIGDGKIFVVSTSGGDSSDVDGVSGAQRGVVFDNKALAMTSSKVSRVDLASKQSKDIIDAGGANDIGVFLGNVYLLFAEKISKYVPIEGGSYSGPTEYLNSPANFGAKSRFAIDGSIWVTSGKQIFKFTRGEKEDFEISGLVDGVGEFGLICTNSSLDNLYVVDTTNSALLVISKDGIYKEVYQAPEFAKASGVVINDAEDEMFVAVGNKILSAKLK